jgi:hypothetical protein
MFLSGVLFPVFLLLSRAVDDGFPMIIPFLIFFAALTIMLYARFFGDETSPIKSQQTQTSGLGAMSDRSALPPASNIPIHGVDNLAGQRVKTNELAHPPSVTEHTTKLLDKE